MIEHCRMNWGADSRKASINPDRSVVCFNEKAKAAFEDKRGSITARANKTRKFL
jgi:hypothetical protein